MRALLRCGHCHGSCGWRILRPASARRRLACPHLPSSTRSWRRCSCGATRTGRRFSSTSWTSASGSSFAAPAKCCCGAPGASTCGIRETGSSCGARSASTASPSARANAKKYEQNFLRRTKEPRRARQGAGQRDRRHRRRGAVGHPEPHPANPRAAVRVIGVSPEVQVRRRPIRAGRA